MRLDLPLEFHAVVGEPRFHRLDVRNDVASCLALTLQLADEVHEEVSEPPLILSTTGGQLRRAGSSKDAMEPSLLV